MDTIMKVLQGPIAGTLGAVNDIIGKFVQDPNQKAQAQLAVLQAQQDLTLKLEAASTEWVKAQADVIKAEATSESWLTRNWRPITMMVFVFIVAFNYIVAPLFHLSVLPVPADMWELLKLGITGYVVGRSAEKIIPVVGDAATEIAQHIAAGKK